MSEQSRSKIGRGVNAKLALMVFLALFMFINSSVCADALGVTPGRATVDFEPGLEGKKTFTITNNEHKDFNAFIYVEGDLAEYVTFDKQLLKFSKTENSKTFTYNYKLPERLESPGDHWAKIIVMELPSVAGSDSITEVVATVAVTHQLRVKVPYPGKFLKLDLSVQEAVPNEPVKFFVKLYNLGKEDIARATAVIEIMGPTNEVISTIETEHAGLKSMQKGEMIASWNAEVNPGMYQAVVTVRYDGEVGVIKKNFYVGNMLMDILDVSVKDFNLGDIAKFDILVESKWNQPVSDVYAHMIVTDSEDNKVADLKSASIDITPFERTHIYTYWDTEGVLEGDYLSRLSLHYADRKTEREIKTVVGLNSIRTEIVGVSVGAVTSRGDVLGQYPLVIVVVVLVAINFAWFVYFRRRRG